MNAILSGLVRLLAPIIPFTSEEAWQFAGQKDSVHKQSIPKPAENLGVGVPPNHSTEFKKNLSLRAQVNEKLEQARRDKKIGKNLEACVELAKAQFGDSSDRRAMLEELFIVSKVTIKMTDGEKITVTRAEDHGMKKCVRCWKYYAPETIGTHAEHPELCERCTKVVLNWKG